MYASIHFCILALDLSLKMDVKKIYKQNKKQIKNDSFR